MLCLVILLSTLLCGCRHAAPSAPRQQELEPIAYSAQIVLDAATKRMEGTLQFTFVSPENGLKELCVWAPHGLDGAQCNEQSLSLERQENYTLLALPTVAEAGSEWDIRLRFSMDCAYGAGFVARDFIPLVCAFDQGFLRPQAPDYAPYFRPWAGQVDMTIVAPKTQVVLCSGQLVERTYPDGIQSVRYALDVARPNQMIADPYLARREATVGHTHWEYYATSLHDPVWQTLLSLADAATTLWGEPAHDHVAIVQGSYAATPALVGMAATDMRTIAEAVAAMWAGAPAADAWITPSIERFALYRLYVDIDEKAAYKLRDEARQTLLEYQLLFGQTGDAARMDKPLASYDENAYRALLENKGLLLWSTLREIAGEAIDRAILALRRSPTAPDTAAVMAAVSKTTHHDYSDYFAAWLGGNVLLV